MSEMITDPSSTAGSSRSAGIRAGVRQLGGLPARCVLAAAAITLTALPALAYRIYLKDGTVVATKESYRVEGDLAIATLENGAQTTIRLAEIDVEKTERLNERAYTSAVVIEGREERLLSLDDPAMRQRTLAHYVEERRRDRIERDEGAEPRTRQSSRRLRRTPAGYVDLPALDKERVETAATAALEETLRRHGLGGSQVFRGTGPDRYLLEVLADNEESVFRALESLAAAILELVDAGVSIEALEVYMATGAGSRAGMFTLSEENAALLAGDQIEPAQFFVQFVEF
ncbi:MAG TPA: hypothetical protein VMT85_20485 [Thermoanaerobaculia bacterium]|nr:hypothetical protein [Thermoanaerobaculia bacterium]